MRKDMRNKTGRRKAITLGTIVVGWAAFVLGAIFQSESFIVSILLLSVARVLPRALDLIALQEASHPRPH
jgi:hypothetical protein